ncbi:MAG: hypothetical protein PWQ70_2572 [Clostridiales bacterium]|jgi:hypothetical protein|uniref:helicase-related protein n=1 Tax=Acetomicrobium sp. UBA5826 TaxID=1946039 RepID=UPI00257ED30C|nr:helicase-related protein [Acetomicrobium sp. UBA5826]MDK2800953.1 hypothetical protein [Clostridiales bacterium]
MLEENKYQQFDLNEIFDEDEIELLNENEEDNIDSDANLPTEDEIIDTKQIQKEIAAIQSFINLAEQIKHDSKAKALLIALQKAFGQIELIGANRKALIFTESKRTQAYLKEFLEQNGYKGKIVTFNGSNSDKQSNEILEAWLKANAYTGKISGIRAADRRAAIVDYFKDKAEIMIATEAAAEGLNLQFCSLVVNYDLPWNPQRIEQRIGRCHRYGQKSDVVVVNFVNQRNYADLRVFELLNDKFKLFSDVFGTSDEILGQIDGVDFERRIWLIYQECRTEAEISAAFEKLQAELESKINMRMKDVKEQVLKTFDVEVQERLRLAKEHTCAFINRYEYIFWELAKYILGDKAEFDESDYSFILKECVGESPKGKYCLITRKETDGIPYRLSHPLAQYVLKKASAIKVTGGKVIFSPSETKLNVTLPEDLKGKSGYLLLSSLDVSAFDTEQYSLFTAYTDDGQPLSQELCEKLFLCAGREVKPTGLTPVQQRKLKESAEQHRKGKLQQIDSRNLLYFKEEEERIFQWEKDMINSLERELDTIKRQIREQERLIRNAVTIEEKIAATKKLEQLESFKRRKRNELADREDEIASKRRKLLAELDSRMIKQTHHEDLFAIEWQIV